MRSKEFITENILITDVPNETWLQSKVDYVKSKGRNQFGAPSFVATTGYIRQPDHIVLPVDLLKKLPGAQGEQKNVRSKDLETITKIMKDTGKLPMRNGHEYVPFIGVSYDGQPWVLEGNHRIMAAARLGWKKLPVELKYFDGGERVKSGILYPGKLGLKEPDSGYTVRIN